MDISAISPPPLLSDYVESIWYCVGDSLGHSHERIIPDGSMQLLVNLDENELRWQASDVAPQRVSGAAVAGAWSSSFVIDTRQQKHITGVSFRRGGAAAFFPVPSVAFRNNHVALNDVFSGLDLREQLLSALQMRNGRSRLFATWIDFLTEHFVPHRCPTWLPLACDLLAVNQSVRTVSTACGMDIRRFRAEFSAAVGISPKSFARVRRLQRVMADIAGGATIDRPGWADIALANGYFDQAHMNRDFRLLAGVTPAQYQPRDPLEPNHNPV